MKHGTKGGLPPVGKPHRVVLLTQDEIFASRFQREGQAHNLQIFVASTLKALGKAPLSTFDLCVFNFDLDDGDEVTGIQVAKYLKKRHPKLGVVMVSGISGIWEDPRKQCSNVVMVLSQWAGPDDCLAAILKHLRREEAAEAVARRPVPVLTLSPVTALSQHVTSV